MSDRQVLVRDWLVLLALTGWAVALPSYGSEFMVSMALTCLMYIALSSSWGLFCGSTRYLSLATAAFFGIGADEQRAQTLGVNTRLVKIAGFMLTAAFAGATGAAMSVRWTYIDPSTVFNPFIGFQTVLIALIGGAGTLWGPLIAAIGFSLLAETLRLKLPHVYMMSLGLLLILSVLFLPGGLASLRRETLNGWGRGLQAWWRDLPRRLRGEATDDAARERWERQRRSGMPP